MKDIELVLNYMLIHSVAFVKLLLSVSEKKMCKVTLRENLMKHRNLDHRIAFYIKKELRIGLVSQTGLYPKYRF